MLMKKRFRKVLTGERCLTAVKPEKWYWHQLGVDRRGKGRSRVSQTFATKDFAEKAEARDLIKWKAWV